MLIQFLDRPSDSPLVDRVWTSHSERAGSFHSMATCNWVMVVTRLRGETSFTVRGPETRATIAECPAEGEWIGIHFKPGSFMPLFPLDCISDRRDVSLPGSRRRFWLDGAQWEYPGFENAETFVSRLAKKGLLTSDPRVAAALQGEPSRRSRRTDQRRFHRATGMTAATFRQIERARAATALLRDGRAPIDVAYDLGYFDQAHLTRSLRRFIGQTPVQVARAQEQLSLLYKAG